MLAIRCLCVYKVFVTLLLIFRFLLSFQIFFFVICTVFECNVVSKGDIYGRLY